MTDTKLAPCPFCGGVARMASEPDGDGTRWHYIVCCGCGVRTRGKWHSWGNDCPQLRQEVRDEWNHRAWAPRRQHFEEAASIVERMTARKRQVAALVNSEPAKPCEYAAALRAAGAEKEQEGSEG